jgi:hypothetical protein
MARFMDTQPEKIETISDRIISKLDKEYPEYREFQELIEERRHEVDIIPYIILISTEENECDMHCIDTDEEVKDYIKETLGEQSGWSVAHIFHSGKEIEYEINIMLIDKK